MAQAIFDGPHSGQQSERQMILGGFRTFLQTRGEPETVLERARSFGHVALVQACRCAPADNDNGCPAATAPSLRAGATQSQHE
jgi:hypothetical protein